MEPNHNNFEPAHELPQPVESDSSTGIEAQSIAPAEGQAFKTPPIVPVAKQPAQPVFDNPIQAPQPNSNTQG